MKRAKDGAKGRHQELEVRRDPDGSVEIWWEDLFIIGTGRTFEDAKVDALRMAAHFVKLLSRFDENPAPKAKARTTHRRSHPRTAAND